MTDGAEAHRIDYASRLREEIRMQRRDEQDGLTYTEQIFTRWCADLLEENGFIPGFEASHWEFAPPAHSTQMKINGHHLSDESGDEALNASLFVSSWIEDPEEATSLPRRKIESLVNVGTTFLQRAILTKPPLFKSLEPNDPHTEFARALWAGRDNIKTITLHILVNGLVAGGAPGQRLLGDIPLRIEVWDARRLVRVHEGRLDKQDEIVVEFPDGLPCVHCPITDGRYDAYLAVIPGVKLAQIYETHGPRLLQENVRAFLQLSVAVNKGIRRTLQEEPASFFAYNNGLSATATEVQTSGTSGFLRIDRITGLQIVNGAQTTGSIHRAWRNKETRLEAVHVPLKLTRVNEDSRQDVVTLISKYANSQTSVKLDDFSANHPFHIKLEQLSRRLWAPPGESTRWYYERTRGQYHDEASRHPEPTHFKREAPPSRRFTKTDVARYVHAWEARPSLVSLGSQKNFVQFSAKWIKEGWLPDDAWYRELIAKAILFEAVDSAVRKKRLPGYVAQVIAYIVSIFSNRYGSRTDLKSIWDRQALSSPMILWLQEWSHPVYEGLVSSAAGRNVTEWCKKPACWEALRDLPLPDAPLGIPEISSPDTQPEAGHSRLRGEGGRNIDFSTEREEALKLARDIVSGRTIRREDAIRQLQAQLGIGRLSAEKRSELDDLFEDLAHIAFIDDPETESINDGLAFLRKLLRSGSREHSRLVTEVARGWLGKQRAGSRILARIENLFEIAQERRVIARQGDDILCPTPSFDSYDADQLAGTVLSIIQRRGRLYPRAAIQEATVRALGFTQLRDDMLRRVEDAIEGLLSARQLESPSVGWLRRAGRELE